MPMPHRQPKHQWSKHMKRPGGEPRSLGLLPGAYLMALMLALSTTGNAAGLDSRIAIERAVLQIDLGDQALARSYLQRPLIDPRITITERSRAYYLQGYSLELEGHYLSAAQNYARALTFNPDNPATLAALGNLYARGQGVEQDNQRAIELLRRSAQLGHAPGMTRLGASLLSNLAESANPGQDLEEARAVLAAATEVNDPEAFVFLAQSYRASHTKDPDPEQARHLYEQALILNEPSAFNSIGHMHLGGELGESNPQAAITAFERGAQANDGPAQVSLGYLYLVGSHVEQNTGVARQLFLQAAANDESVAHHYLGYLEETDPESASAEQAHNRAIDHYKKAAAHNHAPALKRLSELAFADEQHAAGLRYLKAFVQASRHTTRTDNASAATSYWRANHHLAWMLATHWDTALRDGEAAVKFAEASVNHARTAATLDTLAAAYAEKRDFDAAISTQQAALQALENLKAPAPQERLDDYSQRLASYQKGSPWRDLPSAITGNIESTKTQATVAPE